MELTEPQLIAAFVMLMVVGLVMACVRFNPPQWVDEDEGE